MQNDMSLFHQQKWRLDKIQLTLAIQLSDFFFTIVYLQRVNEVSIH